LTLSGLFLCSRWLERIDYALPSGTVPVPDP